MLQPKRTKFRKMQKGRNRGLALRGSKVSFGEYGLKAIGRGGKIWIRVFPDKPIPGKPLEVRQGKGKGNVEYWVAQVQPGKVLYEVQGVSEQLAREAFTLASAKIPVATKFVKRSVM